jgi:hypothetical protein
MDGISFAFTKSSRCLVLFSVAARDGPDPRAVDGEACTPHVDEAWMPADITFSAMRSIRISSMDFSAALISSDMHTRDLISQVGEQYSL